MLMKTLAYLECPTGIAGDMCLGALVHAGVPISYLTEQLSRLGIQHEFGLRAQSVQRNQQSATKVYVDLQNQAHEHNQSNRTHDQHTDSQHTNSQPSHHHSRPHSHHNSHYHNHREEHSHSRRLPEIEQMIQQADLPKRATQWSLSVFRQLARAEAAVHGIPPEQVHFHEVGATDAIVDIVGTCLGLDWLKVDELVCSPLPTGGGTVRCEHGLLPVPAPAVLNMMTSANVPVYSNGIEKELVTPTGCAIATTLAQSFGPPPRFTLQKIGLGAGGRDLALPNILRLWIGTTDAHHQTAHSHMHSYIHSHARGSARSYVHPQEDSHTEASTALEAENTRIKEALTTVEATTVEATTVETIVELQTQIDDCSPQVIGYLFEQLLTLGALDVFSQAVTMKKNRLGTLLSVICHKNLVSACETLLFKETTTLGIRRLTQTRSILDRVFITVSTDYGEVSVKVAREQESQAILNIQPEYEDCVLLARSHNLPLQQIHQAATSAAIAQLLPNNSIPTGESI